MAGITKALRGTTRLAASIRKQAGKKRKTMEPEGARLDPETGGSVRAAREVESGQAGEVTRGKASTMGGVVAESTSKGAKKAAATKAALQRKVDNGTATKAEKEQLKAMRLKDQLDLSRAQQAAGQTRKARKPEGRTDFIDPETGEIFGKPTQKQLEAAARNARARGMTAKEREYAAFLEKEYGVKFYAGGVANKKYVNLVTSVDNRKKR
jgi:hypothetical protein